MEYEVTAESAEPQSARIVLIIPRLGGSLKLVTTEQEPTPTELHAGRWRDLAVERACEAMSAVRRFAHLGFLPAKVQELLGAPAGSVMLFTANASDTAAAVFSPGLAEFRKPVPLPYNAVFSPTLEVPMRSVQYDNGSNLKIQRKSEISSFPTRLSKPYRAQI